MLKLYQMEMKKVWKKPINKVCILSFLVFSIMLAVTSYQRYFHKGTWEDASITIDGQTYQGFAAIKEIDKVHHTIAMQTDVMDSAWYAKLQEDVHDKLDAVKEIDEQQMQQVYGNNWKQLYEACQNQTLTYKDYKPIGKEVQQQPDDIVLLADFPIYYTQASQNEQQMLRKLYLPSIPQPFLHKEKYVLTTDKIAEALRMNQKDPLAWTWDEYPQTMLQHIERSYDDSQITYINERFLNVKTIFDAKQGYEYFIRSAESLETCLPLGLLLLMVILSGIFNQEYSAKTDQILHAVAIGSGKQALAKIATGMSFTLLLCGLGLLCILGIPWLLIGFYSLEQMTAGMPITLRENMQIFTLMFVVSCFSYGAVFLTISSYTQNRFISFILSGIWMLISSYLGYILGDLLRFVLPGSFMIPPFDYELISLFDRVTLRCYATALVWLLLSCILLYLTYRHYKKREITNA